MSPSPTHHDAGAGCTQCYTNGDCKTCKKGYYLDALKRCQLCNVPNCEACDATGACAACKKVRLEQLTMQPGSLLRTNTARSQVESREARQNATAPAALTPHKQPPPPLPSPGLLYRCRWRLHRLHPARLRQVRIPRWRYLRGVPEGLVHPN